MDIKNCTHTRGGHPWRFYTDDGDGCFPIHGAVFVGGWRITEHAKDGTHPTRESFDLDPANWQDQIPWDQLVDEVICVTWDPLKEWIGWLGSPTKGKFGWIRVPSSSSGSGYGLGIIKMPQPPDDWHKAIARRPEKL